MGFPNRLNRADLGPTYEEDFPVTDPTKEIGAAVVNRSYWQLVGAQLCVPRAVVVAKIIAGPDIETEQQLLAWDAAGGTPLLLWTRNDVGDYTLDFLAQYADERGQLQNLSLAFGEASVMGLGAVPAKRARVQRVSGIEFQVSTFVDSTDAAAELASTDRLIVKLW